MTAEERLKTKNVRPTAMRLLVLQALMESKGPVSLADLEGRLGTVDRSTIFRAVLLFEQHHLVHAFEDGSGSLKYELCPDEHTHHLSDGHAHFYCAECGRTFCLPQMSAGPLCLPPGFEPDSVNLVIKGFCPRCARRHALQHSDE